MVTSFRYSPLGCDTIQSQSSKKQTSSTVLRALVQRDPGQGTVKRKHRILQVATKLFAQKGYDGTTTLDIAKEAGVTEPLIFYYFKTKAGLYSRILQDTFQIYFDRLEMLAREESTPLARIESLIGMHLDIVDEIPDAVLLIVSTCPSGLGDPDGICTENYTSAGVRIRDFIFRTLERGIADGEFKDVDVKQTTNVLFALVNGLLRQRAFGLFDDRGVRETAMEFCRASLMKGK